ncbi:hypothetical protein BRADI_2g38981v3 [Brachypodium distachyon]|uniref:Uncharacterized protein n=1 Tax=Brachypodium distachyon TaxID=15368 RepID=A0A2K2DCR6_BRADI|nr:hypothetical protein BRADI_2g38981v3 [Brachypodium distachyon]
MAAPCVGSGAAGWDSEAFGLASTPLSKVRRQQWWRAAVGGCHGGGGGCGGWETLTAPAPPLYPLPIHLGPDLGRPKGHQGPGPGRACSPRGPRAPPPQAKAILQKSPKLQVICDLVLKSVK